MLHHSGFDTPVLVGTGKSVFKYTPFCEYTFWCSRTMACTVSMLTHFRIIHGNQHNFHIQFIYKKTDILYFTKDL